MAELLDTNELAAVSKMYMECFNIRTATTLNHLSIADSCITSLDCEQKQELVEEIIKDIEHTQRKNLITAVDELEIKNVGCDFKLIEKPGKDIIEISGKECSWTGYLE